MVPSLADLRAGLAMAMLWPPKEYMLMGPRSGIATEVPLDESASLIHRVLPGKGPENDPTLLPSC